MNIDWKRPDYVKGSNERQTLDMVLLDIIQAGIATTKAEAMKFARRKVPDEGWYQKRIMDKLRDYAAARGLPCIVWKAAQGAFSRGGVADVLAVIGGVPVAVEVKRPLFGELSALQEQFIKDFNAAGGVACCAVYPEDLAEPLARVSEIAEKRGAAGA